jgi:hypothetical protein
VVVGSLAILGAILLVLAITLISIWIRDWGCLGVALASAVGGYIATSNGRITYVGPIVHGVLNVFAAAASAEFALIAMLGLRSASGLFLRHTTFVFGWFPPSPPEKADHEQPD